MISQNSRSDSRDRAKNGATNSAKERKDLKNPHSLLLQIQSTFDKGNKIEFFKAFDALIPSELKKRDFQYKKLEFYLQIYFVVYKRHPNINQQNVV